jgi:probable F420-dependent oxidoreductase
MDRSYDLSAYALPGRDADSRVAINHAIAAERIGLGAIWASERWEGKETGAICGAIAQATSRVKIVAGLVHFTGRHPLVAAGLGATMQRLSGNRFVMGVGRSSPERLKRQGFPVFNMAHMREYADILRRLWRGERVTYEGRLGKFEDLELLQIPEQAPPVILGATGPKTLALGGEAFDGVVLHPFLTVEGARKSIGIVREAAERAGRDPASVHVTACVVTAPDTLPDEEKRRIVDARAMTYFRGPALAKALVDANDWDESHLEPLLNSGLRGFEPKGVDSDSVKRLTEAAKLMPTEWLTEGAAVGNVQHIVKRYDEYRAAGADEILIHGSTPDMLGPIVDAYREHQTSAHPTI